MRKVFIVCWALCLSACVWRGDDMRFKFQTSGQLLDIVSPVEKVIEGRGLLPATPSDAKIFRDAQNNALIEWKRRGRINYHWRDRAGVPVSEESEYYEIEVLSGSTVVRTVRIPVGQSQPVQWTQDIGTGFADLTYSTDGSGTVYRSTLHAFTFPNLVSRQKLDGDFVYACETYHDGTDVYNLPANTLLEPVIQGTGANLGDIQTSLSYPAQMFLSTSSGTSFFNAVAGDKFVFSHIHGETRIYKNPSGDDSPTIYTASFADAAAPYQVRLVFDHNNSNGVRNPTLLRFTTPDWTYTADMQTADGLTPGNPLHLKIYQVSAQVGRGRPLEVTL